MSLRRCQRQKDYNLYNCVSTVFRTSLQADSPKTSVCPPGVDFTLVPKARVEDHVPSYRTLHVALGYSALAHQANLVGLREFFNDELC